MDLGISSILGVPVKGKRVLFRPDINSPIDENGTIVSDNRLVQTAPTLRYLLECGAKVAIIAHQGDTLDYQNLVPMVQHAAKLSKLLGRNIRYMDDVCGDAALRAIENLKEGEAVLLGNLRYLTEEVSTFENDVKLAPTAMQKTYLVRRLKPLFDLYVNDAFSAAHRNCPSMTGFQPHLPSYAGPLFFKEYETLHRVMNSAERPVVFVLGGAKISDAFGMMEHVLKGGIADRILAGGVTGIVMQMAKGVLFGTANDNWLQNKNLLSFVPLAKQLLEAYGDRFVLPTDFAYLADGARQECGLSDLPKHDAQFLDIGEHTAQTFSAHIHAAQTVFVNGPMGVYEDERFAYGTKSVWRALQNTAGYTVLGGGDTVSATERFINKEDIDYICTAGGAMVRFLSGKTLPLVEAMRGAKRG